MRHSSESTVTFVAQRGLRAALITVRVRLDKSRVHVIVVQNDQLKVVCAHHGICARFPQQRDDGHEDEECFGTSSYHGCRFRQTITCGAPCSTTVGE